MYIYLERINNLVRAQEQQLAAQFDLQPVQLRMLHFLGTCNRYSDTPAGVADFVQLTKGTVSQSLKMLETKGYIEKRGDAQDKRQVHLIVTQAGRAVLNHLPPPLLTTVSAEMGTKKTEESADLLHSLLLTMQHTNAMQGFDVCRTCHYHRPIDDERFGCGLTGETLSTPEAELLCREHIPLTSAPTGNGK